MADSLGDLGAAPIALVFGGLLLSRNSDEIARWIFRGFRQTIIGEFCIDFE